MHYWASPIEARLCEGQGVALVGAGNSAGQAAVYLASHVRKAALLARGGSLDASMSRYLVERIKALVRRKSLSWKRPGEISAICVGATAPAAWNNTPDPPSRSVHRRRPEYGLAGEMQRGAGGEGFRPHRSRPGLGGWCAGDEPQRRGCHRRRTVPARSNASRLPSANVPRHATLHTYLAQGGRHAFGSRYRQRKINGCC